MPMISTYLLPSLIHLPIVPASWRRGTACIPTACVVGGDGGGVVFIVAMHVGVVRAVGSRCHSPWGGLVLVS